MKLSFRHYRIFVLLLIFGLVVWDQWLDREEFRAWDHPLRIVVYPINADGSQASASYIAGLRERHFQPIEALVQQQADVYGLTLEQPLEIVLGPEVNELPPQPPAGGNVLDIMWWNFKVRRWANNVDESTGERAHIRAFMQFFDHQANGWLSHSVGVEKGRLAIVNLYATRAMAAENNMVLLHEILHTLGASDKYDLANNQPLFPQGYAEPELKPLHPQRRAEVMAGRIPVTDHSYASPQRLTDVIIGRQTAFEIGWLKTLE